MFPTALLARPGAFLHVESGLNAVDASILRGNTPPWNALSWPSKVPMAGKLL